MMNPFTPFLLDILPISTLAGCIAAYRRMLLLLSRFSDGSQIQRILAQAGQTLAKPVKEAEKRMRLAPVASKVQPVIVPVSRPLV